MLGFGGNCKQQENENGILLEQFGFGTGEECPKTAEDVRPFARLFYVPRFVFYYNRQQL